MVLFEQKPENFPQEIEIPQNWFLGGFEENEFVNEKFLRCIIEGPWVNFQENFYFARWPWN